RFGAASKHEAFPETPKVEDIPGRRSLNTVADLLAGEEEAIELDGIINVAQQFRELREKAEKHAFQTEVNEPLASPRSTVEFISKITDTETKSDDVGDLIGQFGVGFYSAFLVANTGILTTMHNDNKQYIWESDASSFTIAKDSLCWIKHQAKMWFNLALAKDPRGPMLKHGTQITQKLKEEAWDFLEQDTLCNLMKKTEMVDDEVLEEDEEQVKPEKTEDETETDVEEEKEEAKPKTKQVEKTTWDWEFLNDAKPIREVSFKALLYVPNGLPNEAFNSYGEKTDNIRLYLCDEFSSLMISKSMMPIYLSFVLGIVDSEDLPLNVSRENLQQHKLLKIIKKKLVWKALDMMKKLAG
ncbi:unnamed protein product, partial [Notodromas monacha]